MSEFFNPYAIGHSLLFSKLHLSILMITLISIIILILKKTSIQDLPNKGKIILQNLMAILLFLNMSLYYLSYLYYGYWRFEYHLPLHFCFITGYLWMYSILFKKYNYLPTLFLFVFMGPIPAIIYWDLVVGFDHFVIYHFIISHNLFLLFSIFVFISQKVSLRLNDTIKAYVLANIIFGVMYIFNSIFNTNYIFSNSFPQHLLTLYPFLVYFSPILFIEITGLMMIALGFCVSLMINKKTNVQKDLDVVDANEHTI